jgi:hypothetical protein
LPRQVERLYGDRGDPQVLRAALGKREFDLVVDTTLYNGRDAEPIVDLLLNRTGRYIFISTGQVYLVRVGLEHPYREEDYAGPVMPGPLQSSAYDYENWVYGVEKRAAEDVLMRGWVERRLPVTTLRLPMVNSERDYHNRIYGYYLRLCDGGPILIPEGPGLPLRHVYGGMWCKLCCVWPERASALAALTTSRKTRLFPWTRSSTNWPASPMRNCGLCGFLVND